MLTGYSKARILTERMHLANLALEEAIASPELVVHSSEAGWEHTPKVRYIYQALAYRLSDFYFSMIDLNDNRASTPEHSHVVVGHLMSDFSKHQGDYFCYLVYWFMKNCENSGFYFKDLLKESHSKHNFHFRQLIEDDDDVLGFAWTIQKAPIQVKALAVYMALEMHNNWHFISKYSTEEER